MSLDLSESQSMKENIECVLKNLKEIIKISCDTWEDFPGEDSQSRKIRTDMNKICLSADIARDALTAYRGSIISYLEPYQKMVEALRYLQRLSS